MITDAGSQAGVSVPPSSGPEPPSSGPEPLS